MLTANRFDKEHNALVILDQTFLPSEVKYISLTTVPQVHEAISKLRVRGAPAIGIAAAYGMLLGAVLASNLSFDAFLTEVANNKSYLDSSRPTAVNLSWATSEMLAACNDCQSIKQAISSMMATAYQIHEDDKRNNKIISEYGLSLLKEGMGILTHCNAGPIATSIYGTGLGPILLGQERGYNFKAYCDETRPLLQGARLTTLELTEAGVDTTLICDNMAATLMAEGKIHACLVGCDRVALNGDTANKIGTMNVAILAKHFNIPFYVLGPTSTIDVSLKSGAQIPIELRDGNEITQMWYKSSMAPTACKTYNPAFDVTPNNLITAIITEHGIITPPFYDNIKEIMGK